MFKIENPLTLMSVFCGIAEIAIVYGVRDAQGASQIVMAIFSSLFPFFISGFFFYIVYFKHEALYAPKDFRNENSFLELANKLRSEVVESIANVDAPPEEKERLVNNINNAFGSAEDSHYKSNIFLMLSENGEMSSGEIAQALGIRASSAMTFLKSLLNAGDVEKRMVSNRSVWRIS